MQMGGNALARIQGGGRQGTTPSCCNQTTAVLQDPLI